MQIKTARVTNGQIRWATCSNSPYRSRQENSYQDDGDIWFAVWSPVLRRLWMVPARECGRKEAVLRLEPARNNQIKKVRFASEYEVVA